MSASIDVVVSVGTDHHPFDRLIDWIERWSAVHPDAAVLVQRGTSRSPEGVESVELMAPEELRARMASAHAVVVQGGPGGITESLRVGRRPIVVPRRQDQGEHVDDHQVAFTRVMADEGRVEKAETEEDLVRLLDAVAADPTFLRQDPTGEADGATAATVGRLVGGLIVAPRGVRART